MNFQNKENHHHHHHHHKHQGLDLWSVPSPELQLLAPTLLRSSNCSPSLWSVAVWFRRDYFPVHVYTHSDATDVCALPCWRCRHRQCTYKRNSESLLCNCCYRAKALSIAYSGCVPVAIVVGHAMRMCRIFISDPNGFTPFFPHYFINGAIFGKVIKNIFFIFVYKCCVETFWLWEEFSEILS